MSDLPPLQVESPLPSPRSSWPVTFGVLAIVFGCLGALGAAWGIIAATAMSPFGDFSASPSTPGGSSADVAEEVDQMMNAMQESYDRWIPLLVASNVGLLALAILLLVAGILLLNRNPRSATLLTVWAYGKIVVGIGAALVGFQMQQGQMRGVQESMSSLAASPGGGVPTSMDTWFTVILGVTFFGGVIWTCALPVVYLIWLNRDVVKSDVASWAPVRPGE